MICASKPFVNYKFSNNWFERNFRIHSQLIEEFKPKSYLEIGVFEGQSIVHNIQEMLKHSECIAVTSIDPFYPSGNDARSDERHVEENYKFNMNLLLDNYNSNRKRIQFRHYKETSFNAICKLFSEGNPAFDLIYVDGSHTPQDALADAVMTFQALKPGGIIIFDDYVSKAQIGIDAFKSCFFGDYRLFPTAPIGNLILQKN